MGQLMDWYNQQSGLGQIGSTAGGLIGNYGMLQQQTSYDPLIPYYPTTTTNTTSASDFQVYLNMVQGAAQVAQQSLQKAVKLVKTGKLLLDLRKEIDRAFIISGWEGPASHRGRTLGKGPLRQKLGR